MLFASSAPQNNDNNRQNEDSEDVDCDCTKKHESSPGKFLSRKLSEWYPNRDDLQHYLLNVSTIMNLHNFTSSGKLFLNKNAFEENVSRFLDSEAYKDCSNDFKRKLEINLQKWYSTESEYYRELSDVVGLPSLLVASGPDSVKKKEVYENSVLDVLNLESRTANRTYAVWLRVRNLLSSRRIQGKTKFIENGVTNVLRSDMIFNDKLLNKCFEQLTSKIYRIAFEKSFVPPEYQPMHEKIREGLLQTYLMDILPPRELHKSTDSSKEEEEEEYKCDFGEKYRRVMGWPRSYQSEIKQQIEKRTEYLLSTNYNFLAGEESKIISEVGSNTGLIFLNDENFEEKVQQTIVNAGLEVVKGSWATLEKNLELWYPTTIENIREFVKTPKILLMLIKEGAVSQIDTFENKIKNILKDDQKNRVKLLKARIVKILVEKYSNNTTFRDDILKDMNNKIYFEFEAHLIFEERTMEKSVQKAVQERKEQIIQNFFGERRNVDEDDKNEYMWFSKIIPRSRLIEERDSTLVDAPFDEAEIRNFTIRRMENMTKGNGYSSSEILESIIETLGSTVGLLSLSDEALEKQIKAFIEPLEEQKNALIEASMKQKTLDELKVKLQQSLKNWYPLNNDFYQNLVSSPSLAWLIREIDAGSDKNKFEQTVTNILNFEDEARIIALTLRIKIMLTQEYPNCKEFHEKVLKNMEHIIQNELKADLIFDDKKLFEHILEGVRVTEKKMSDFFFGVPLRKIESGHSNSCYDFLLPVLEASTNAPEAITENTDEK